MEIDFKNQDSIVLELKNKKKIIKYNTNNTLNRKRFLLINYSEMRIKFNGIKINMYEFLPQNPYTSEKNSIKYTIYSLEKKYILSNFLDIEENSVNYSDNYSEYSPLIDGIQEEIKSLINSETDKMSENLLKKIKIKIPKVNLNISKTKIKDKLSKEEYLNFEINSILVKLIFSFLDECETDLNMLKKLYGYFSEIVNKIKNDNKLKLYQKILILNQYYTTSQKFTLLKDFINSRFNYYIISEAENNSVLSYTQKFFIDFISKLTEKHKAFDKLLELDGEIGFYKGESYFCFNMENIIEVKTHLREKLPDILTIYNNNNNENCAVVDPYIGLVTINMKSFKKFEKIDLMKSLDASNLKEGKNYASKIITYLLHEVPGHIKFSYSNSCKNHSPSKFLNYSNKICELVSENKESDDKNQITILEGNKKYDSGTFFELLYGKIGKFYVSQILDYLYDYGKLVDRVDLLLDNLALFNEYIKLHFCSLLSKNIFDNIDHLSIEDEIKVMKVYFETNNIDCDKLLNLNLNEEEEEEEDEDEDEDEYYNEDSNNKQQNDNIMDENGKSNSIIINNKEKEKKNLKEKNKSRYIYEVFSKKYPHFKKMFKPNYTQKPRELSLKDIMLRNFFMKSIDLPYELKKIHDDPNLSQEMKYEYYAIYNTILTCD